MKHEITVAETEGQIAACLPGLRVLRPHLAGLTNEEFVEKLVRQGQEGYRLVALTSKGRVRSIAGFRVLEFLAWGKVLYVDDLVTLPDQTGKGYGGALLDWLIGQARREGCNELHLDSGYVRHDAHRLYLGRGMKLHCHHFSMVLDERASS